jgi:predicted ester cyclase
MCGTIGTVNGRDNVAAMIGTFIAALPDLKATEQVVVAEGDYVFVWGVVEGTHRATSSVSRPPAGSPLRLTDGKIAKEWAGRVQGPRSWPSLACIRPPGCRESRPGSETDQAGRG